MQLAKGRADVVVNHVDINRAGVQGIDWSSPLAAQHGVRFTPYFKMYDPSGKLLGEGKPASRKVEEFLQKAGLL